MKTKELIRNLKKLDPSGEFDCQVGGAKISGLDCKEKTININVESSQEMVVQDNAAVEKEEFSITITENKVLSAVADVFGGILPLFGCSLPHDPEERKKKTKELISKGHEMYKDLKIR